MAPIVIYPSRTRVSLILLGSIAFVAMGVWMLTLPFEEIGVKGTIAAWLCLPLFGASALFALSRLFSKMPALTIDSTGITDNASGLSAGFIPWSDITGAGIATFQRQKFLGISLRNPQDYLAKASLFKRLLMKTNSSWVGYMVNIPQVALPVTLEDVLAHVNHYRQISGGMPNA